MIIEVTKENFEEEVLRPGKLVLVDFWGPQCGPCKQLAPEIEKIAEEFSENLKIVKVDVSKNRRLCVEFRVLSLPTIIFFKNGKEIARLSTNIATKNHIRETIIYLLEVTT
jgi:thioredoxin 1